MAYLPSHRDMEFASILNSTAELAVYPHILHEGIGIDPGANKTAAPVSSANSAGRDGRPTRGITHLAVILAFVLPITLFPYMLARRQLSSLRRQLVASQTSIKILEQELNLSWREVMSRKYETQQLRRMIGEITQDAEKQKSLFAQREIERSEFESEVKSDLQKLLKDARKSRTQAVALRALGTSLADVAAFMHEIELEMGLLSVHGNDQRGIGRMRSLALLMEKIEPHPAVQPLTNKPGARVDEVDP